MSIYDTHIVNAGSSHLYGFEIEATHSPSGAFDWYASVGYSRTRFDEFATTVGSVTDYDGLEFRSEEHTSELQSLMRISYAVFCLKKKQDKPLNNHSQFRTNWTINIQPPRHTLLPTM